MFLKIITKHFGRSRKDNLHKILNKKTLKIGYSCTQNFENIIQNHNKRILKEKRKETENEKKTVIVKHKMNVHSTKTAWFLVLFI